MVEPGLYRASSGPDPAVTEPRAGGPDQYRAPSGPDFFSQGPNGPNFRHFELLYKEQWNIVGLGHILGN